MRLASRLLAVVLVAGLGGCASGPDAQEWAGQVCRALEPWRSDIDDLTTEANAAMSPKSSPAQAKQDLEDLLSGAAEATDEARVDIVDAGVPDVESGESIAKRFVDALEATRDAYRNARDGVAKLDSGDAGFYDSVAKVMKRLSSDYDDVPQVAQLDNDELRDAFNSAEQCR